MDVSKILVVIVVWAVLAGPAFAAKSEIPPELRGSDESHRRQNEVADKYGFTRVANIREMERLECAGIITRVHNPDTPIFYLDLKNEGVRRFPYLRMHAKEFLGDFAADIFPDTGYSLGLSSFGRTIPYQIYLENRRSGIRSDADMKILWKRSAHLTFSAFDFPRRWAHRQMTENELNLIRAKLIYWKAEGVIWAIEEEINNVFHVMVFPEYFYSSEELAKWKTDAEILEENKELCPKQAAIEKKSVKKKVPIKKSPKR